VFYPDHLNLNGIENWKIYADKIRSIMAKVIDVEEAESTREDMKEYYNRYLPELQKDIAKGKV